MVLTSKEHRQPLCCSIDDGACVLLHNLRSTKALLNGQSASMASRHVFGRVGSEVEFAACQLGSGLHSVGLRYPLARVCMRVSGVVGGICERRQRFWHLINSIDERSVSNERKSPFGEGRHIALEDMRWQLYILDSSKVTNRAPSFEVGTLTWEALWHKRLCSVFCCFTFVLLSRFWRIYTH